MASQTPASTSHKMLPVVCTRPLQQIDGCCQGRSRAVPPSSISSVARPLTGTTCAVGADTRRCDAVLPQGG